MKMTRCNMNQVLYPSTKKLNKNKYGYSGVGHTHLGSLTQDPFTIGGESLGTIRKLVQLGSRQTGDPM